MDIISYALSKKGMQQSVSDYLDEHLTNPTNPPIDTSLKIAGAAADAKATGGKIDELKSGLSEMQTATAEDIGKALTAKTVTDGKVTEWEFGETGGEKVITDVKYDDANVKNYASTNGTTNSNQRSIVIAPNEDSPYFIKSASVLTKDAGTEIVFSVFDVKPFSDQPDPLNRKKFIRAYDIASIVSDADGLAEITFDVPLYLVPNEQALVALCATGSMKYGSYKDARYTINNYDHDWWSLAIGEYYTNPTFNGYGYITSGTCPYYTIDYISADNVTVTAYKPYQLMQLAENYNQYDSEVNKDSKNAVRNSALYNELNIVKTETLIPTETVFKNGESPSSYAYGACSLEVPFEDVVLLKSVDVRAQSGDVKLGIWTFRRHSDDPSSANYNRGYFTLKTLLGTVAPTDTHAVFDLNDVEFDPKTEILMATSGTSKLSFQRGFANSLMPLTDNNTTLDGTAVGEECQTLYWYHSGGTYPNQLVYSITYQLKESKTVTTVTNVKDAVDGLIADVEEGTSVLRRDIFVVSETTS